jgi:hypothetical protein
MSEAAAPQLQAPNGRGDEIVKGTVLMSDMPEKTKQINLASLLMHIF